MTYMFLAFVAAASFISMLLALLAALERSNALKEARRRIQELENPELAVPEWVGGTDPEDDGKLIDFSGWRESHRGEEDH